MNGINLFTYRHRLSRFVYLVRKTPALYHATLSSSIKAQNVSAAQPFLSRCPLQNALLCCQYNDLPCCVAVQARNFQGSHSLKSQKETDTEKPNVQPEQPEKLSLVQRYKKMLKEYWYVLLPVHMLTSTVWFGTFYYIAKSGFDIVPFLEMLSLPESFIKPLRNSSLGYIAVASALYKIATPARYMVTLGGTTMAIKYLTKRGLIKPVPSKDKFKSMIKSKLQSAKDRS